MSRRRILLTTIFAILVALLAVTYTQLIDPSVFGRVISKFSTPSTLTMSTKPVIVVGSGLAGLCASYEALRAGARVHMLDRAPKPGGNSIKASSGINGANTPWQKAAGVSEDTTFYSDSVKSGGVRFKANDGPDRDGLVKLLIDKSADAISFLVDEIGVDLSVVAPLGGHSQPRTHRGSGKLPPGAATVNALLGKLKENEGFTLSSSAEVAGLVQRDGKVTGIEYILDGEKRTLKGPVMFATGGFAGDANGMMARIRPDLKGFPATAEVRPGTHDMLTAVGAALVDMDSVQVHPTGWIDPASPEALSKFLAAEVLRGEGGIMLDESGKRFVNEMETRDHVSAAIMAKPPMESSDGSIKQWNVTLLLDPGACEAAASHLGFYLFKGLTQKKKIKDLDANVQATLKEYSDIVAGKNSDSFGRTSFGHWRLKPDEDYGEKEVCVGKTTPVVHFTMGGVAFNDKAQVLDGEMRPIPGLFAAGEVTGGIHGDNRLGGSSLLECVVYGRIAGIEATKEVM